MDIWMNYLDISTTMKGQGQKPGILVEGNPAMVPYVIPGRPWLMVWGKLVNGEWILIVELIVTIVAFWFPVVAIPLVVLALGCGYNAYTTWTGAVKPNEVLDNKYDVKG